MRTCAAFVLLAALAPGAVAQNSGPAGVWFSAGHVALEATERTRGLAAEWQFDRADNGDVRIVKHERRGFADVNGVVLSVCGDQALLLKDIAAARQRELQELNEPVLYLQLALRLLARALPGGLPAEERDIEIDIGDEKNTLRLRKGDRARKDIGAPWRARGAVRRSAAGVRFDFTVTYAGDEPPHRQSELKLAGMWEQPSRMPVLDNAFDIAGWRVHRVDTVSAVAGGNTVFEPVVATSALNFATLGELRARIGRGWDPDVKARQRTECKP